jgi:hypothetical protein
VAYGGKPEDAFDVGDTIASGLWLFGKANFAGWDPDHISHELGQN